MLNLLSWVAYSYISHVVYWIVIFFIFDWFELLAIRVRGCLLGSWFCLKWNISVSSQLLTTVYMMRTKMKFILCVISFHFERNEILLWVIKYHTKTTRNEIIWKETSAHAFISSKQKWLALDCFSWTTPEMKHHFILLVMKYNQR